MPNKPPNTAKLVCTLTLQLETDTGRRPTQQQMVQASEALVTTIRSRLFGEGFLPADTCVDTYDISVD